MSEDNKDIDKLFQSTLEPFKMDPPDEAWNSLDAELARERAIQYRKKANRLRLLSIILGLLLISFVTYHFIWASGDTASENVIGKVDYKKSQGSVNTDLKETNSKPIVTETAKPGTGTVANNSTENLISVKDKKEALLHQSNKDSEKRFLGNEFKATSKRNSNVLDVHHRKPNPVDQNALPSNHIKNAVKNSFINTNSILPAHVDEINATGKNKFAENGSFVSSIPPVYGKQVTIAKQAEQLVITRENNGKDRFESELISNKESRLSVAFFYSPDYIANHLKANGSSGEDEVAEYHAHEKSEYSFTTGILFRYELNRKWSILSGCTYSTLSYSISIPTLFAETGLSSELHYQYPTSCGVIEIPNQGNITLQDGDSLNVNAGCAQVLKLISVPLMVRFQLTKNRFTWYANAGAAVNFVTQEKAKVIIGNSATTIVNRIDGLKKMNCSILFGVGVQYSLHNGMGIFLEPVFRGSVTSITENADVYCYPYSFGLNTGISFHF